jgi:hypothetical protein
MLVYHGILETSIERQVPVRRYFPTPDYRKAWQMGADSVGLAVPGALGRASAVRLNPFLHTRFRFHPYTLPRVASVDP